MAKKPTKPPEDGPPSKDWEEEANEGLDPNTASMFGDDPGSGGGPQAYQVLARKYRPSTFDDLVGQEAMVRTLTNAFKTGRIAHAFMLTGVRGVGKTTTARLLARALNFKDAKTDAPSMNLHENGKGEVHGPSIMASTHPDVLELDAASHTGVADMRDLLDGSRYAPVSARYKVYIIDEVHMLSTAAFNALLKTLEEPPPHVKFIFATTEIRKVPVTVLSRCQRFNLQRFSTEALADHLANIAKKENVEAEPEALALIARAAEGSARDALSILDQAISTLNVAWGDGTDVLYGDGSKMRYGGGIESATVRDMLGLADRSRVLDLMDKAVAGDHKAALEEATSLLEAGADATVLIKDLMDAATEVSRAQALRDAYTYAGPKDWAERTQAMAQKLSPAQAARIWRLLLQGFEDCAKAPDPPAAAQMVVLRLAAVAALPPPEEASRPLAASASEVAPRRADAPRPRVEAPTATIEAEPHDGPRLSTLAMIIDELDARREIALKYEIERFVRPAEIDFGHFRYTAAPGAPVDLSNRIRLWLEATSGVEWEVYQDDDGGAETTAEVRTRRARERLARAEAHPRIAEALKTFPGARVLRVDEPEQAEVFEEPSAASANPNNVIHVDFAPRERVEEIVPIDPDEEDDD